MAVYRTTTNAHSYATPYVRRQDCRLAGSAGSDCYRFRCPPPPFPRTGHNCGGRRRLSSQSDSHTLDLDDIDQGLKTRDLAPIIEGRRCAVDAH